MIAGINREFRAKKARANNATRTCLRLGEIDSSLVRITQKFLRLPFAYITENCEGHFERTPNGQRIPVEEIKEG